MEQIKHTPFGNNAAISIHVKVIKVMKRLGFSDEQDKLWWYRKSMLNNFISFNVYIKKNRSAWHIDIIDDRTGEKYDYLAALEVNPDDEFAKEVNKKANRQMLKLKREKLITMWESGDRIY